MQLKVRLSVQAVEQMRGFLDAGTTHDTVARRQERAPAKGWVSKLFSCSLPNPYATG
jgi:hypothetical protein